MRSHSNPRLCTTLKTFECNLPRAWRHFEVEQRLFRGRTLAIFPKTGSASRIDRCVRVQRLRTSPFAGPLFPDTLQKILPRERMLIFPSYSSIQRQRDHGRREIPAPSMGFHSLLSSFVACSRLHCSLCSQQ